MNHRIRAAWATVGLWAAATGLSGGELRGRVIAADKPQAGVTVAAVALESPLEVARREARRQEDPKALASTTTGPDGTFVLTLPMAPSAPPLRLRLSGGGVAGILLARVFDASDSEELGDLIATRAEALAGRVVDPAGGPVVGATVTRWNGTGDAWPVNATTGADGSFKFADASERGNRLRVEAPGFAMAELAGLRSGALRRPVALGLGRSASGNVVASDRRSPVSGALVRYEGAMTGRWVETRADGSFTLEGVPREGGTVIADAGDRGRGKAPAPVGEGKIAITLAPTGSVRGRVVDADTGAPIAGIRVLVQGDTGLLWDRSGKDGRYSVRGLAPRAYRLAVDDPRFVAWERSDVSVTAGQAASQDVPLLRGASLAGRVLDEDGRPIEGAVGQLARAGENRIRFLMRTLDGPSGFRTGKDGSFKATRLAPGGNQRLTFTHPDFDSYTVGGLALAAGSTRAGLTVVLPRGLSLRGLVKNENGQPMAGVDVELTRSFSFQSGRGATQFSLIGPPQNRPKKQTGPEGRFEFRGLGTGDYSLSATKNGFARERVDPVKVSEGRSLEPLELVLKSGATISGFVRDRAGSGVAGYRVGARPAGAGGGMGPFGGVFAEEPTGPDGAFFLEGLSTGQTYDLQTLSESGPGPRKSATAPADGVEIAVTGRGYIRGVVSEGEGRPVTDFEVAYSPSGPGGGIRMIFNGPGGRGRGPGQKQPVHAEDGSFLIDDVPAGKWDVVVTATGYQSGRAAGVTVEEGGAAEGVEVRLSQGATLSGRVTDARSGRPVIEGTVRADLSGSGPRFRMMGMGGENETVTDADGHFELVGLAPGTYAVTASHPSWSESTVTAELKDAPLAVDIKLGQGGTVTGSVLNAGRPLPGASVSLSAAGEMMRGPFGGEQSTVTDSAGRFRFERLNPGRYSASASIRGLSTSPVDVALPTADASQEVTLTVAEGALIRGQVSGLPEASRGGVNVNASGPESYFAFTRTAADGTFELTGAPQGAISVRANAGDFLTGSRSASAQVMVAQGQAEATVEVVFETGFRVNGHVTRAGRPVADAMVIAFPEGPSGRSATDRTDEAGAYALEGLKEGSYRIDANLLSGGGTPIHRQVEITGDATIDLEAPFGRLAGTVVEADTKRPVGEARVLVEDVKTGTGPQAFFGTGTMTDSSGRFSLEGLDPKPYRLVVQKAPYQTETKDVTASEDAEVTVELKRGEGIGIVAHDGIFGTPLRGLFVRVRDLQGTNVFMGSVSLDSDGRGEIPSLRPGTYEVRAGGSDYAPVTLRGISVPSPPLTLNLTPGGTIEIQVGPETQGRPNPSARLLAADGSAYIASVFSIDGVIRLGGQPVRRLENVAPGHYTLSVDGGVTRPVDVREGGSATIVLP